MKRCFVIANGESRRDFDVNRLYPYGTVIGINAIYRENPKLDYLVGVDINMMNEVGNTFYKGAEVWTYPRNQIKHQYFRRFKQDKGWRGRLARLCKEDRRMYSPSALESGCRIR